MKTLDQLPVGSIMSVKGIKKDTKIRRKLLDMGVTIGIELKVKGKAPLGDPIEVLVRGYKLTLRKNEAAIIMGE